jgi:hypothetical protein
MTELKWFGHAAHFICGPWCRFHLATQVGDYLISTVGEYWPEREVREIHAEHYDADWWRENRHLKGGHYDAAYMKRFGFMEIGYQRTYETMVFRAGLPCTIESCACGLPGISGSELDFAAYNKAGDAAAGHMLMVEKWASADACYGGADCSSGNP